jgi:hypothetical protein
VRTTDAATWIAATALVISVAAVSNSCTPAPPSTSCADGKGNWISDDNSSLSDTHVTVRVCVNDGGNVLDVEVD